MENSKPEIYDYTHLRRFIGVLALSIGIVTVVLANAPLASISASYWAGEALNLIAARDFFVGAFAWSALFCSRTGAAGDGNRG